MNYYNQGGNPNQQPPLGYSLQFGQPPQQSVVNENLVDAQTENIRAITKINEANATILEANAVRAKVEAMQAAVQLDFMKLSGIRECLLELRTAMSTGKLVPVSAVGDKYMQIESAFSNDGQESLESLYMDLYQKMENEAIKISKQ